MNRQKSLTIPLLKRQAKQRLKQIAGQIVAIDAECRIRIASEAGLSRRFDILISIPGPGEATAFALVADMPELGALENNQAASLVGLAPVDRQSGLWKGKSFIQGSRQTLRQALYMPALARGTGGDTVLYGNWRCGLRTRRGGRRCGGFRRFRQDKALHEPKRSQIQKHDYFGPRQIRA